MSQKYILHVQKTAKRGKKIQSNRSPFCIQYANNMKFIFMASTSPLTIQTPKERRECGNREKEYKALKSQIKLLATQQNKILFDDLFCNIK